MCTNCSFGTWIPGRYIAVGLYSGVPVKRGSTILANYVWVCYIINLFIDSGPPHICAVTGGQYPGSILYPGW